MKRIIGFVLCLIIFALSVCAVYAQGASADDTEIPVTRIVLSGLQAPIAGRSADECICTPTLITYPADAAEILSEEIHWYSFSDVFTGIFESGKEYHCEIRLKIKDGYRIDSDKYRNYTGKTIVNGSDSVYYAETDNSGRVLYIGVKFICTDENPFTDIPSKSWYSPAVLWCNAKGYITGISKTVFNPTGVLTRAMFVQILSRVERVNPDSVSYSGRFRDVTPGRWFAKAVQWALDCNITGGTGADTFSPDAEVTREQLATFFLAYARYKKYSTDAVTELTEYTDAKNISGWALNAVKWAVSEGIIAGTGKTTISPKQSATRAQAAVIFKSFVTSFAEKQK